MQNEMNGRLPAAHHNELGLSLGRGLARVRHGLERLAAWDGTVPQLFAMVAASLITSLGLFATTST